MHHLPPLGFSTGCLYQTHNPIAVETFQSLAAIGADALEISPQSMEDLRALVNNVSAADFSAFSYVSLHPKKVSFHKETLPETIELISRLHEMIGCPAVVHPNEVADLTALQNAPFQVLFENMDARSSTYLDVADFEKLFILIPNSRLVLDLNHCFTNDRTLGLAARFAEAFPEHLAEVHLSGFAGFHEPLYQTHQMEFFQALPGKKVPVIIESGCTSIEMAEQEYQFVKRVLHHGLSRR